MALKKIASVVGEPGGGSCADSTCPTVYVMDTGDLVIQGYKLTATDRDSIALATNEDAIRVPSSLLEKVLPQLKS